MHVYIAKQAQIATACYKFYNPICITVYIANVQYSSCVLHLNITVTQSIETLLHLLVTLLIQNCNMPN